MESDCAKHGIRASGVPRGVSSGHTSVTSSRLSVGRWVLLIGVMSFAAMSVAAEAVSAPTGIADRVAATDRGAGAEALHLSARSLAADEHRLIGEPAPALRLTRLGGGELDFAELLGQDVLVVVFWASWSPPCRARLPELVALAGDGDLRETGARFVAVNLREQPAAINAYLDRAGLNATPGFDVALDGGAAAKAFGVKGIPKAIVIDRSGVVRAVHVGLGPGSGDRLRASIASAQADRLR